MQDLDPARRTLARTSGESLISLGLVLSSLLSSSVPATAQTSARKALTPAEVARSVSRTVVTITSEAGQGSGVIVGSAGVIITNVHVLQGQTDASVKLANGDVYDDVSVIDFDLRRDLLLIKIKAVDLPVASLGNSEHVKTGDKVILIASPKGLDNTISDGLISAVRDSGEGYRWFQTNAAASPGSSGGGMFNEYGELIGVVTSKLTHGENLNFGIPVHYVRGLLSDQTRMTLAQFAARHPKSASNTFGSAATASERRSESQEGTLASVIEGAGWSSVEREGDSWIVNFRGENAESLPVYITPSDTVVVVQALVAREFTPTADNTIKLLKLNYAANFAKLGMAEKGHLVALSEIDPRALDTSWLQTVVRSVATLADDAFAVAGEAPTLTSAAALHGPPDGRSLKTLALLRRRAGLRYDSSSWKQESAGEAGTYQFNHSSGVAFVRILEEAAEIPASKMIDMALAHARNVDPKLIERRRGQRLVNGIPMLFVEFDGTVENVAATFFGHYYMGPSGTVQMLGWAVRDVTEVYLPKIEEFVSGFYVASR